MQNGVYRFFFEIQISQHQPQKEALQKVIFYKIISQK